MINVNIPLNNNRQDVNFVMDYYRDYKVSSDNQYMFFKAKKGTLQVIIYINKDKEFTTLTLQNSIDYLDKEIKEHFKLDLSHLSEENISKEWIDLDEQIGSDEVGVGDTFAPICVCASMIKKEDIPFLRKLKVDDSKKLNDAYIRKIAPYLIKRIPYSQVSLTNEKYNELILQGENLNTIKAKLHNTALLNLKKRYPEIKHIYVDEFVNANKYYQYLFLEDEIVDNIVFKTNGETYFPSVATSSIIARYSLLRKVDKISEIYHYPIPLGSNAKIKEAFQTIYQKYGLETLRKLVKANFKNFINFLKENNLN